MINVQENISLKKFNTFRINVNAQQMLDFTDEKDIYEISGIYDIKSKPFLVLGGGSNILFSASFKGLVIHPINKGIEKVKEDGTHVWLHVNAGEVWDDFVSYAVANNYGGVENLSNIPGNVGASPIQNIGAYGTEISEAIESVRFYNIEKSCFEEIEGKKCEFSYRSSIFKTAFKHKIIISSVYFRLRKNPVINVSYKALSEKLDKNKNSGLKDVRNAVIDIRRQKLPDPKDIGNAGSFFKNPIIPNEVFGKLNSTYNCITSYPVDDSHVKIPAAWLIELSGWKGKRLGNTGVYPHQSLVLVNYENASGKEILALAHQIVESVYKKFGIELELEVNVI